jgi:hypothetical protein
MSTFSALEARHGNSDIAEVVLVVAVPGLWKHPISMSQRLAVPGIGQ